MNQSERNLPANNCIRTVKARAVAALGRSISGAKVSQWSPCHNNRRLAYQRPAITDTDVAIISGIAATNAADSSTCSQTQGLWLTFNKYRIPTQYGISGQEKTRRRATGKQMASTNVATAPFVSESSCWYETKKAAMYHILCVSVR